jgi:maleate cis-trans isomerase
MFLKDNLPRALDIKKILLLFINGIHKSMIRFLTALGITIMTRRTLIIRRGAKIRSRIQNKKVKDLYQITELSRKQSRQHRRRKK